ncbi:hypothetical protein C672_3539 [[Clostridium] bifermentans ATCC 638]|uniref:Uncharacterized protein n=1 Tax=Paraclostridium bifermentans ATCC 638 = DSM 14991 TaxID=1233171 RepID=T4VGU6_PARBF|nr:hypothetical protein [Paraclostridium bifermentans]EQK39986.1 hypothetical protein C672_3539 [[Clostridium] bifermentans ATCC 638] [Paraclostridium bifermentans ATCC 638 = DSM 14991]RIZ57391.1 hypothetical protein CHH45_16595 [Paraclostridium bifermentans]UAG19931.1 hypothetical protein KXZ80_17155 [Paraclostridium bifermentans]
MTINKILLEKKRNDEILKKYKNVIDSKVHENIVMVLSKEDEEYSLWDISKNYIEAFKDQVRDSFWIDKESELLGAIIGYIKKVHKENSSKRNLKEIVNFLVYNDFVNYENANELFKVNNVTGEALELWDNYLESTQSELTRQSVGVGLIHKIQVFFMLEDIRTKKTVIYF